MYIRKSLIVSFLLVFTATIIQPTLSLAHVSGEQISQTSSLTEEDVDRIPFHYSKDREKGSLQNADKNSPKVRINDSRILVKIKDGQAFHPERMGVEPVEISSLLERNHFIAVKVPDDKDYYKTLQRIRLDANVETAEPDYIGELDYIPLDQAYATQWYLDKIDMEKAWEIERGSEDVTVAVLDSGINRTHPDLSGRILPGYDFVNRDQFPIDDLGHGTQVSGIIAANANSLGIIGMDFYAKILPVKIADAAGDISSQNLVEGIYYAIQQGADIINMSLGSSQPSELEKEAIYAAEKAGVVLVAAAGNNQEDVPSFPASYRGVISVSATNSHDRRPNFSNYGQYIDIAAPGTQIYSTYLKKDYISDNGTSFAAPIISGMAALMKSAHPTWDQAQIEWAMEASADSVDGTRWSADYGYGRVNALASLTRELPAWADDMSNEKKSVKKLIFNQSESGSVDYPRDVDWFQTDIEKEGKVTFDVSNSSNMLDLVVAVYDPDGQLQFIDSKGLGKGERFTLNVKKGSYYYAMFENYDHWSEDKYGVKVDFIASEDTKEHGSISFPDVKEYAEQINYLASRGIIQGFPDGEFRPTDQVSRLQTVRMILRELGVDPNKYDAPDPRFKDVKPSSEGYKAIAAAVDLKIIKGRPDQTFDRYGNLTRGQMAAIIDRTYHLQGGYHKDFLDVPKGHEYYDEINALAVNSITTGYEDNTFKPYKEITRQHLSLFLYRTIVGTGDVSVDPLS